MGFTEWIVQILSTDEEGEIESIRKGKPPVKFSAENMKYILKSLRLVRFNSVMGRSFALEILREVVELLIWDDRRAGGNGTQQKQGSLFDIFLEANTTEYFLYLFRLLLKATGTKSDHLSQGHIAELLQVLIILFENISCETSLFYLLSNDYINQIVLFGAPPSSNYDKWEDLPLQEEALAYYVTLIKTLSLKLNISTLPFFFNEQSGLHKGFPMLSTALLLAFHPSESMIRIACRTAVLNIFCMGKRDKKLGAFLLRDVQSDTRSFLKRLTLLLLCYSLLLQEYFDQIDVNSSLSENLESAFNDSVVEWINGILYIRDLLDIGWKELNLLIIDYATESLIRPYICVRHDDKRFKINSKAPFNFHKILKITNEVSTQIENVRVCDEISLWSLSQMLLYLKDTDFATSIVKTLFLEDKYFYSSLREKMKADLSGISSAKTMHTKLLITWLFFSVTKSACNPDILVQLGWSPRFTSRTRELFKVLTKQDTSNPEPISIGVAKTSDSSRLSRSAPTLPVFKQADMVALPNLGPLEEGSSEKATFRSELTEMKHEESAKRPRSSAFYDRKATHQIEDSLSPASIYPKQSEYNAEVFFLLAEALSLLFSNHISISGNIFFVSSYSVVSLLCEILCVPGTSMGLNSLKDCIAPEHYNELVRIKDSVMNRLEQLKSDGKVAAIIFDTTQDFKMDLVSGLLSEKFELYPGKFIKLDLFDILSSKSNTNRKDESVYEIFCKDVAKLDESMISCIKLKHLQVLLNALLGT